MSKWRDSGWLPTAVLTASALTFSYIAYVQLHYYSKDFSEFGKRPEDCSWLDDSAYLVYVAITDALIPHYDENELSEGSIVKSFTKSRCDLKKNNVGINEVLKHKEFLKSGTVEGNYHLFAVKAIQTCLTSDEKFKLYVFLKMLSTSVGCGLLTGNFMPFHALSLEKREKALASLRDSLFCDLRGGFQTMKRLTSSIFLSYSNHRGDSNPGWQYIGYSPALTVSKPFNKDTTDLYPVPKASPKVKQPLLLQDVNTELLRWRSGSKSPQLVKTPKSNKPNHSNEFVFDEVENKILTLDCDVVVVGSGCGGGVVAAELVKAGLDVIVLEKGGYYSKEDFKEWREVEALARCFEKGALCATSDAGIAVLAGSCVGGGSTVNWSACLRTPDYILKEWDEYLGGDSPFRVGGEFQAAQDIIHGQISVNSHFSYREEHQSTESAKKMGVDANFVVNGNNHALWKGAKALNYEVMPIPRNVKSCVDCGHCCHGCAYGSKQSTITALLEPLGVHPDYMNWLHIIPHCHVTRILTANDEGTGALTAVGVEAIVYQHRDSTGSNIEPPLSRKRIQVNASAVVSSCGSLHTPALLLRSGLKNEKIGKHLTLHPVIGCGGLFPNETNIAGGVSMGVLVKPKPYSPGDTEPGALRYSQPKRIEIAVETPPVHPGVMGLVAQWSNGLALKSFFLNHRYLCAFLNLPRDYSQESNCIMINNDGEPVIHYQITEYDKKQMLAGFEAECRLMKAAGCEVLMPAQEGHEWCTDVQNDAEFERFLKNSIEAGIVTNKCAIFSAHQMSSCRMSPSPELGPVQKTGETWECANLYVADASVLPTSLGVNPMITIESLAFVISRNIMKRMNVSPGPLKL